MNNTLGLYILKIPISLSVSYERERLGFINSTNTPMIVEELSLRNFTNNLTS
jgi:hypothetical protein